MAKTADTIAIYSRKSHHLQRSDHIGKRTHIDHHPVFTFYHTSRLRVC